MSTAAPRIQVSSQGGLLVPDGVGGPIVPDKIDTTRELRNERSKPGRGHRGRREHPGAIYAGNRHCTMASPRREGCGRARRSSRRSRPNLQRRLSARHRFQQALFDRETVSSSTTFHLNASGVEAAGEGLRDQIPACDLVVLSKFGKREAMHQGSADAFTTAMAAGKPVLTSISEKHRDAWRAFVPEATLPPTRPRSRLGGMTRAARKNHRTV